MSSGYKDLSIAPNRLYRKSWNGTDTPTGTPISEKENPYAMYGYDCLKGGKIKVQYIAPYETVLSDPAWPTHDFVGVASVEQLKLAALGKVATKLRGHDFQLPVTLGEGKETVVFIANTLKRFVQSARAFRKGNPGDAVRILAGGETRRVGKRHEDLLVESSKRLNPDDLASFWLGSRYAWRPMLHDVYNACEALRVHSNDQKWKTTSGSSMDYKVYNGASVPLWLNVPTTSKRSVKVKVKLKMAPSLPEAMGLTNPLSVAWELLPLSFVFDWVMPVGTYLDVLATIPVTGTTVVTSVRETVKAKGITTLGRTGGAPRYMAYSTDGCHLVYNYTKLDRTVGGVSVPKPQLVQPGDIFDWKRVTDVAAIGKLLFSPSWKQVIHRG